MPKISQTDIENLSVPLSSINEQKQVVKKIQDMFTRADSAELAVREGMRETTILERSVFIQAFRGDLVSQNPNDEPVSVTLERIRAYCGEMSKKEKLHTMLQ